MKIFKTFIMCSLCCMFLPLHASKVSVFTYAFNRPEFVRFQKDTLEKFLLDDYEFVVFNDAKTPSTYREIREVCNELGLRCVDMPQKLHTSTNASGRNAAIVNYSLRKEGFNHPGIVILLDSDMFLVKPFSVEGYMKHHPLSGLYQSRSQGNAFIEYLWIGLVFLDMPNLPGRKYIDFSPGNVKGVQTDTGGNTHYYLSRHKNLSIGSLDMKYTKHAYQNLLEGRDLFEYGFDESQIQYVKDSKGDDSEFYLEGHFFHYRGGSNWDNQSSLHHENKTSAFRNYMESILRN